MRPGPKDVKLTILITGDELLELQRLTGASYFHEGEGSDFSSF